MQTAPNARWAKKLKKRAIIISSAILPTFWSIFVVARFVPAWWVSVPWGIVAGCATIGLIIIGVAFWMEYADEIERMKR